MSMRKAALAIIAAGAMTASVSFPKSADAHCWGCWAGAGLAIGMIGGAMAGSGYGYGYGGGYGYGYGYPAYGYATYRPYYGYRGGYYRRPYYGAPRVAHYGARVGYYGGPRVGHYGGARV